jgi:hypothetical protein
MEAKIIEFCVLGLINGISILFSSIFVIIILKRSSNYQVAIIHASNVLVQAATISSAVFNHDIRTQWAARHLGYFRLVLVCTTLYGLFVIDTKILRAFGTIDRNQFSLDRIKMVQNAGLLVFLVLNVPNFVIRVINVLTDDKLLPSWTEQLGHYSLFLWFFLFIVYDNSQAISLFLLILKRTHRSKLDKKINEQMKWNLAVCAFDWVFVILTMIITFIDFPNWKILQHFTMASIGFHVYLLVNVYQGLSAVFEERSVNGLKMECLQADAKSIDQSKEIHASPSTQDDLD